jgi:hypothetical protein
MKKYRKTQVTIHLLSELAGEKSDWEHDWIPKQDVWTCFADKAHG